jgi:hypothetical protein
MTTEIVLLIVGSFWVGVCSGALFVAVAAFGGKS